MCADRHPSIDEMLNQPICPNCATPLVKEEQDGELLSTYCPNCHWEEEE